MLTAAAAPSKARPARGAIRAAKGLIPPSSPPPYPKKNCKRRSNKKGLKISQKSHFTSTSDGLKFFFILKWFLGYN